MEFHAKEQLPGLLDWMRQQMKACGGKTAVIGISGGKDSSVVAALAVAAYGKENVVGVLMPDGIQPDIDYSNGLVEFLGIRHYVFNIQGGTGGILDEMARLGMKPSRQTTVNLPSRMRMVTLYAIAQSENAGIVLNTSNLSEDWVGYCTVYGDATGAFSPLGMYTTEEVIALGAELGLPEKFLIKPPSDGLTGLTDEDNLGFTYHAVNEYVRKGVVDPAVKEKIDRLHRTSRSPLQIPADAGVSQWPAHGPDGRDGLLQVRKHKNPSPLGEGFLLCVLGGRKRIGLGGPFASIKIPEHFCEIMCLL